VALFEDSRRASKAEKLREQEGFELKGQTKKISKAGELERQETGQKSCLLPEEISFRAYTILYS
jgi:hypothetical protein